MQQQKKKHTTQSTAFNLLDPLKQEMTKQSIQTVSVEPSALLCITQHSAEFLYNAKHRFQNFWK